MIKYLVGWLMPILLLFVVTTIGSANELPALPGVVYDVSAKKAVLMGRRNFGFGCLTRRARKSSSLICSIY